MMKIVIDTNIIISAALTPNGNPARIIDFILNTDSIQLVYSTEILEEYRHVLSRTKLNIAAEVQCAICNGVEQVGKMISPIKSDIPFADESDRMFYDTAKAVGAVLITGNIKHFPDEPFIMTPADFINEISG